MKKIDLSSPDLYFNRELSWLKFNSRVLAQAQDGVLPPLEEVKILFAKFYWGQNFRMEVLLWIRRLAWGLKFHYFKA